MELRLYEAMSSKDSRKGQPVEETKGPGLPILTQRLWSQEPGSLMGIPTQWTTVWKDIQGHRGLASVPVCSLGGSPRFFCYFPQVITCAIKEEKRPPHDTGYLSEDE